MVSITKMCILSVLFHVFLKDTEMVLPTKKTYIFLFVLVPPVFGLGTETLHTPTIRIPFYSIQSITELQYNVTDSHGRIYNDQSFMKIVDSNVTVEFNGYHRNVKGQTFIWNITESGITIPVNLSFSIWNEFGTSVYQFYWQPYSNQNLGEF